MTAYKNIAYGLSIIIDDIEYGINDRVVWRWADESRQHKSRIYHTVNDSYFKINGQRHNLSEFIRADYV